MKALAGAYVDWYVDHAPSWWVGTRCHARLRRHAWRRLGDTCPDCGVYLVPTIDGRAAAPVHEPGCPATPR